MSESSWRECAEWMVRVGFISSDHELMHSSSKLSHLVCFLKDGVVLCHLLNKLSPGCIDRKKFSPLPESQFSAASNIKAFLDCCCVTFKIPLSYRFDAMKLVRMENITEVLKCLSELSKRSQTTTNVIPFSVKGSIYRTFVCTDEEEAKNYNYTTTDDELYETFVQVAKTEQESGMVKSQLACCIDELMNTEKNYIGILNEINKLFLEHLQSLMHTTDFDLLFSNINKLLKMHKLFYDELERSLDEDNVIDIADVFIQYKEKFLVYGDYCRKLQSAIDLLDKLTKTNDAFRCRLEHCEAQFKPRKHKLHDLLVMPMQRVLKYHLILQVLLKNSPISKVQSLKMALEETQDMASYVNEVTRDHKILSQISILQSRIENLPKIELKNFGRTIKDGEVNIRIPLNSSAKLRHLFLFDKQIIICKHKDDNYTFLEACDTETIVIGGIVKKLNFRGKARYTCNVKCKDPSKSFVLSSKKRSELESWIGALRSAKDNIAPDKSRVPHIFILTSFDSVTICDVCKKLLRGMYCQGYLYKEGKIVAHKSCLGEAQKLMKITESTLPPKSIDVESQITKGPGQEYYLNQKLEQQPWFVETLDREITVQLLALFPDSTFLVRKSPRGQDEYSLNVKYSNAVQNIKIYRREGKFYLNSTRLFSSIMELVSFYQSNSLESVFHTVQTKLMTPIKDEKPLENSEYGKALVDKTVIGSDWLDFKYGDKILIVDKPHGHNWIGYLNYKIGKFKANFVEICRETTH